MDKAYVLGRTGGAGWPSVAIAVSRTGRVGIVLSSELQADGTVGAVPRGRIGGDRGVMKLVNSGARPSPLSLAAGEANLDTMPDRVEKDSAPKS